MSTLKKLFASLASLAVLLGTSATAIATFSDVPSWAQPAVDALVEQGVIDGSKPNFESARNVQRDEFTKMVVEAAVGGVDPDLVPATPTFTDLPTTAWSYGHVETANTLEIVGGYPDGSFRAANPANRAEAVKIIVNGFALETMNEPKENYTDVADTDWYAGYVTTAANHCLINTDRSTFRPADNLIRAEAAQLIYNAWRISNGEDLCDDGEEPGLDPEGDEDEDGIKNADDNCPMDANEDQADEDNDGTGDVCEGATGPATSDLKVELSDETPEGRTVPKGGNNVDFLLLDLTATGDEDVEVTGITVAREGVGEREDIERVKVLDGFRKRGSDRSFNSDEEIAALNLSNDPVVVEAGTTKTVRIAADIDTGAQEGGEHRFLIDLASDITAIGAETGGDVEVEGDFPVEGETMRIGSVNVGELNFEFQSVADNQLEVGENDAELCRVKVTAGSAEDVLVQAITLEFDGVDDGDLSNLVLEVQGDAISEVVDGLDNGFATFDLTGLEDGGWLLADGDTRTFRCQGDISGGVDEDLTVQFDEVETDVAAIGMRYGFGVNLTESGNSPVIAINGGDINLTVSSRSSDVAPDTDEVVWGTVTLSNMGESIEVQDGLRLILNHSGAGTDANAAADLTDVKLRKVGGSTLFGPEDPEVGDVDLVTLGDQAGVFVEFSDQVTVESGEELVMEIVSDIEPGADQDAEFFWEVDMDTLVVEGIDSGDESQGGSLNTGDVHEIRPVGNPTSATYTIDEPTLTVSRRSTNDDTYVAKADDVLAWAGTLRSNGVEDLEVRSIAFQENGTMTDADVDQFSLYMVEGSTRTLIESGEDLSGGVVTFNSLDSDGTSGILVPAGKEVRLELRADIAATLSGVNPTMIMRVFNADAVEAEDEEGDEANVVGNFPVTGATYTLADVGSIDVTLNDAETPDSMILVADGAERWVEVGAYEFSPDDEDAEVSDLTVDINDVDTTGTLGSDVLNDSEAIDGVALYYDDGTAVANGQTFDVTSGEAFLEDIDLTIEAGEETTIFVRVLLNEIDEDVSNAESGMAFTLNLDFGANAYEIRGASSGDEYGEPAVTVDDEGAELTDESDIMYVMRNKITAEKVSSSTALTGGANRELLRFKTVKADAGSDAFLTEVTATISTTGGASVTAATLELLNDQNQVIDTDATAIAAGATATVTFTGFQDEIEGVDETYTIRATLGTDGADDQVVTTIFINGAEPGNDGITWLDAGAEGDGTDGAEMPWIDLGTNESTTRIENVLDN